MKAAVDRMTRVALATATSAISDTVFLVNPASANGSTGRRWAEMAHRAATKGLEGDALFSERPGQLGELARGGGRGREAPRRRRRRRLGERGRERDRGPRGRRDRDDPARHRLGLRRTYAIPHALDGAIDVALAGTARTIDLGRASYRAWDGGDGESYFANVASAGMSGAIAQRANETTKALGGKVSYLLATFAVFAKWESSELRLTVDGETRTGRMHDVVVANEKTFGGGMIICPDAEPDDGVFDVLTIGDLTKRDLLVTLPKTYRGAHLPHPKAELLRGSVVTVDADAPQPVELDGEQPGTTPVRFEIVPRALRLRARRQVTAVTRPGASSALRAWRDRLRRLGGRRLLRHRLRRRGHLLLERRDALLERVETAQLLLHLVQSRLRLVHHVDDLRAAGHVRELVQRLLTELRHAGEDVALLGRACCSGHVRDRTRPSTPS